MIPKRKLPNLSTKKIPNKPIKKSKTHLPKSKYDANGNPILVIPDLDESHLDSEIDKYLNNEDD